MSGYDGYVTISTKMDTSGIDTGMKNIEKKLNSVEKNSSNMVSKMIKAFLGLKVIGSVFKSITSEMDSAISRVDTMANYTKVMANLGIASEDAEASIKVLSDKLQGLPTTLNDAASAVQRFASANGNVKASTEIFLALNNAILAGGADMGIQASALEQLSQAYAKGKPDMMEWRTAMMAMPAQLKQTAQAMGYVSADQLGEALRSGKVSMNEFMITLTKLNKEGVNGFASFEEQALNSTGGIRTSMTNMKTAITRGLADIMNAIGQSNIAAFFNGITKAINKAIPYIVAFVRVLMTAVNTVLGLFGIKTKKATKTATDSMTGLGNAASTTADNINDTADATGKLNKKLKQLAAFDEMNVLQEPSGSGKETDTGLGALGNIDMSDFDTSMDSVASKADEIEKKLMEVFGKIKKIFEEGIKTDAFQSFFKFLVDYGEFIWKYYSILGQSLTTNIVNTFNNVKGDLSQIFTNLTELWTLFWQDADNAVNTWGDIIINDANNLFNSVWKDAIDPYIQLIVKGWKDFTGILLKVWEEHGEGILDGIGGFVDTTIKLFQSLWDNLLYPIIEPLLDMIDWLWDKHLKEMVFQVIDFVGTLIENALIIYNKVFAPIVSWIMGYLSPAFAGAASLISGVFGTAIGFISDLFSSLMLVMKGVIKFITGIFTGDWKKAWQGVKDIFSGIMNGISSQIKLVLNVVIDILNAFFATWNKIKVPDWIPGIGGKGFKIPKLAKLAKGGIINYPGRGIPVGGAIAGERGQEGVIPLTDSQQMALLGEAIGKYITINANITNNMNGRVISRELQKIQNGNDFAFNK